MNISNKYKYLLDDDNAKLLLSLIKKELPQDSIYINRLFKEIKLIIQFNFTEIFLQVSMILELTKGIPHIIRGSAGSCLLCYLMDITNIDPIKENITLSRFMHKNRKDIPDIDIDFPSHLRDNIYQKIFAEWENKVARISNYVLYKQKSALREAIRQEGYRKRIPKNFELNDIFSDIKKIESINKKKNELLGKMRCYSLHCGGIVIFNEKVPEDLILMRKDNNNITQIKLNKDDTEKQNYIKIDILSNRGLSQLMDISDKPISSYSLDCHKTLELFKNGDNIGLTHSESRAMYKVYKTMQPKSIKEIAIAIALIRPAASKGYQKADFLRDYNRYKRSNSYIIFDDDATLFLKKILKCDSSTADNYRRAFAKNKVKQKSECIKLIKQSEIIDDDEQVDIIIKRLEQLEYYSFCKSHAYSYAQLIWALAYQKVNNPLKFWWSTLNNNNSSYRKWVHFREAQKAGLIICLGSKPFTLNNNILIPKKYYNNISDNTNINIENQYQYKKYGYWIGDTFLNNCYYYEYWKDITPMHKNINKYIIYNKKMRYANFYGLIATGRAYKKDDNKGFLTFITIGSNDGIYHDIIINGYNKINQYDIISGYGKIKLDGSIDVIKWNGIVL
jgi:DNA polymerase III alpha subunit